MIKTEPFFRAALSAALLTFAGAAMAADAPGQLAQSSQPGMESSPPGAPPPAAGGTEAPPAAGGSDSPAAGGSDTPPAAGSTDTPSASGGAAATLDAKEGMDVVNAQGEKIGEVAAIEGEQIIVSVGGFLGMGAREVALNKSELQMTGTGEEAKLQTAMTQEELEKLPAHESSSGGAGSPSGGSMPESGGSAPPSGGSMPESGGSSAPPSGGGSTTP